MTVSVSSHQEPFIRTFIIFVFLFIHKSFCPHIFILVNIWISPIFFFFFFFFLLNKSLLVFGDMSHHLSNENKTVEICFEILKKMFLSDNILLWKNVKRKLIIFGWIKYVCLLILFRNLAPSETLLFQILAQTSFVKSFCLTFNKRQKEVY